MTMSDNIFSCLPQSKRLLEPYSDVSEVKPFSWVGRHEWHKLPLDNEYIMAIFDNKSIREIEVMYRQEPKIEAPLSSEK